jgi:hypothetical protein
MPEFTGRLRTPRLPTAPTSPVAGEMYYDTAANKLYYWNGTAWTDTSGGTGGGGSTISAAAIQFGQGASNGTNGAGGGTGTTMSLGPVVREDPAGAFIRNIDQTVSVRDAGWYTIDAQVGTNANLPANTPVGAGINKNGTEITLAIAEGYYYARIPTSATLYLVPTDKINPTGWSTAAISTFAIYMLSIARVGGPVGPAGPVGGNATVPMDLVHYVGAAGEPAFANGWLNYNTSSKARFRIDPLGVVRITGIVKSGTTGVGIFTLPVGFRPVAQVDFQTVSAGVEGRVSVDTNGIVYAEGGSNTYLYLDGVQFDTETVAAMPTGPAGPIGLTPTVNAAAAWMPAMTLANVACYGWVGIPISPLTIEPSDAFTQTANSVTVKDAGWYHVAAGICEASPSAFSLFVALSTSSTSGDGNIANGSGGPTAFSRAQCDGAIKLAAGATVYLHAYSPNSGAVARCFNFSIERIGGPTGPAGPMGAINSPSFQKRQNTSAVAQSGPSNGATWVYNIANAPYLDLTPGTWRIDASAMFSSNVPDFVVVALYNETLATGVGGSAGSSVAVQTVSGALGYGWAECDNVITVTGNHRYRIWVLPAGTSTQTIPAASSLPTANMFAYLIGPGPTGPTGGNATVPVDPWHIVGAAGEPAFVNSWVGSNPSYQQPSFRKDPLGRVWIRGSFGGSPTAGLAFTLPVGYRPTAQYVFDVLLDSGAAGGYVTVDTAGSVSLQRSSSASIYVDLSFDSGTVTAMPTGPQGPPGPGVRGLVTVLPANPQDGDECYFQADATNGVIWHLRYRVASSSAYKWEVIGGSDLYVSYGADEYGPLNAWAAVTGMQMTLPLAGDYLVRWGAVLYSNVTGVSSLIGISLNSTTAIVAGSIQAGHYNFQNVGYANYGERQREARLTGVPTAAVLRMLRQSSVAANGGVQNPWMAAVPIRVG